MNARLNELRLNAGLARLEEPISAVVALDRDGSIVDPRIGLELYGRYVIEEAVRVVEDQFWSDPHEVYQALDLIKNHFGI